MHEQEKEHIRRKLKEEHETSVHDLKQKNAKQFYHVQRALQKIRLDQKNIRELAVSLKQKYVDILSNELDPDQVTLNRIICEAIRQVLSNRDRVEKNQRREIDKLEEEKMQCMKENSQMQRTLTDTLGAYRRLQKRMNKTKQQQQVDQ
jgi:hypothetical protein